MEELFDRLKTYIHFTGNELKLIAIICMIIDHIGYEFFPDIIAFRVVGRIAFPIFAFLIAEGTFYTKNPKKYGLKLFLFALISEIPFDLFSRPSRLFEIFKPSLLSVGSSSFDTIGLFGDSFLDSQNVMWTLFLGFLCSLVVYKSQNLLLVFLSFIGTVIAASVMNTDYGAFGVVLIFICAMMRKQRPLMEIAMALLIIMYCSIFLYQNPGSPFSYARFAELISCVIIMFYNGERGTKCELKSFAYIFYPLHLTVLFGIYALVYFIQ